VVAGTRLALGARERVLFARLRMKEHREVAADREIAEGEKLAGIGADDDPVAISDASTEQSITNRTTHEITLHRVLLPVVTARRWTVDSIPWPRDAERTT
jgi:hypothetical protein